MLKTTIIGRLGKEWTARETKSGKTMYANTIAISNKDKETTWVNLKAFGKSGEILSQYTQKGTQLYCEGRVQASAWVDKQGETKASLELIVNEFQFIDSVKKDTQELTQDFQAYENEIPF